MSSQIAALQSELIRVYNEAIKSSAKVTEVVKQLTRIEKKYNEATELKERIETIKGIVPAGKKNREIKTTMQEYKKLIDELTTQGAANENLTANEMKTDDVVESKTANEEIVLDDACDINESADDDDTSMPSSVDLDLAGEDCKPANIEKKTFKEHCQTVVGYINYIKKTLVKAYKPSAVLDNHMNAKGIITEELEALGPLDEALGISAKDDSKLIYRRSLYKGKDTTEVLTGTGLAINRNDICGLDYDTHGVHTEGLRRQAYNKMLEKLPKKVDGEGCVECKTKSYGIHMFPVIDDKFLNLWRDAYGDSNHETFKLAEEGTDLEIFVPNNKETFVPFVLPNTQVKDDEGNIKVYEYINDSSDETIVTKTITAYLIDIGVYPQILDKMIADQLAREIHGDNEPEPVEGADETVPDDMCLAIINGLTMLNYSSHTGEKEGATNQVKLFNVVRAILNLPAKYHDDAIGAVRSANISVKAEEEIDHIRNDTQYSIFSWKYLSGVIHRQRSDYWKHAIYPIMKKMKWEESRTHMNKIDVNDMFHLLNIKVTAENNMYGSIESDDTINADAYFRVLKDLSKIIRWVSGFEKDAYLYKCHDKHSDRFTVKLVPRKQLQEALNFTVFYRKNKNDTYSQITAWQVLQAHKSKLGVMNFKFITKHPNYYQLFPGLKWHKRDTLTEEKCREIMAHWFVLVEQDICKNDPEKYNYVHKWIHWKVTEFGRQTQCAMIIKGQHGTGKGAFTDWLSVIFDGFVVKNITDVSKLSGFNAMLANKLLVICNELTDSKHNKKANWDDIKTKITEDTIVIEPKNIDAYEDDNYNDYIFVSNHLNPGRIEKTDRSRWIVLETDSSYKDHESIRFMKELARVAKKPEDERFAEVCTFAEAFMTYYTNYVTCTPKEIMNAPETKEMEEMKEFSATSIDRFITKYYSVFNGLGMTKTMLKKIISDSEKEAAEYNKENPYGKKKKSLLDEMGFDNYDTLVNTLNAKLEFKKRMVRVGTRRTSMDSWKFSSAQQAVYYEPRTNENEPDMDLSELQTLEDVKALIAQDPKLECLDVEAIKDQLLVVYHSTEDTSVQESIKDYMIELGIVSDKVKTEKWAMSLYGFLKK